jgi:ribosomal protein S8
VSNLVLAILNLFYKEGFISGFAFNPKNSHEVVVFLKYINGKSFLKNCFVLSTPGQRYYIRKNKSRFFKSGLFLISTSKHGIVLTNNSTCNEGGEVIAQIFI